MAEVTIEELQRMIDLRLNKMTDDAVKDVLNAGGAVAVQVFKDATRAAGHVKSGTMVNSAGLKGPALSSSAKWYVVCHFDGTDDRPGHHGVRNNTKAHVIDSGKKAKSRGIYGRHITPDKRFVGTRGDKFLTKKGDGAKDRAKLQGLQAMQDRIDELMKE